MSKSFTAGLALTLLFCVPTRAQFVSLEVDPFGGKVIHDDIRAKAKKLNVPVEAIVRVVVEVVKEAGFSCVSISRISTFTDSAYVLICNDWEDIFFVSDDENGVSVKRV